MSYIGPLTKDFIEMCSKELKKKETKDKIIKNFIDPITKELFNRYMVYIVCFTLIQLLIIILLIVLIYLVKNIQK